MRILFHIGTDKAGSTAIQQHLWMNREWLLERQVYLPEQGLGDNNGHAALFEEDSEQGLQALADELLSARAQRHRLAVISWEGMSLFSRQRIERLQALLSPADFTVLVYLREQADIVQTGYLQQLKQLSHKIPLSAFESPRGIMEWLRSRRARKHPYRNYLKLVRRWHESLNGSDMVVRIFDRELLYEGDVVSDFMHQLGLAIDSSFIRLGRVANASLDVEAALLINQWQRDGVSQEQLLARIDAAQSWIAEHGPGHRYFLSAPAVDAIRHHYRRSNAALAQQYLNSDVQTVRVQRDCWLQDSWADIEAAAQAREEELIALAQQPVHRGPLLSGSAMASGAQLISGWQLPESWGHWSAGDESALRLRLPFRSLLPSHRQLRLYLKGRYYGSNERTQVRINGHDLGAHALTHQHSGLLFDLESLAPHQTLDILLNHLRPISPRTYEQSEDDRELAYGLESIGYELLSDND